MKFRESVHPSKSVWYYVKAKISTLTLLIEAHNPTRVTRQRITVLHELLHVELFYSSIHAYFEGLGIIQLSKLQRQSN